MKRFKPAMPSLAWLIVLLLAFASLAHAAPSRPFKATLQGAEAFGNLPRCPAPPGSPPGGGGGGTIHGTGHATHLGAMQVDASHCIDAKPDNVLYVFEGKMTLTAANGDTVFVDYSGFLTPLTTGGRSFEGNFYITGGTGRFQNASGSGALFGTEGTGPLDPATGAPIISLTADGRISY